MGLGASIEVRLMGELGLEHKWRVEHDVKSLLALVASARDVDP